ncbi:hypothetical protein QTP88_006063 [Uroleucon formosanum]
MGGVAILVRVRIKQQVIPNLNLLSLEAVAVLIKLNNRYVTIVSAYQPPSRQMQMSDYDKVMNLDNSIIMAGDLNAKHTNWGCRVINPNGTKLLSFIANTPYTIYAPNEPTYFPSDVNRQPDILDILLIKSFPLICTQEALAELDSGHIPVKITINSSSQSYQSNNSLIKGKPNWDIFSNQINTNLIIPKTIPTIQAAEQMSEHLTTVIADAARACSKPTLHNTKNIGFLPQYTLSLIQRKHHARRIWQNQRNTENKKILNKLTKDVRTALQNYRVSSYNSYLLNMYPGDSNLWKKTKRLLNQEINIIPPLRTANQLVISDADKCSVFSEMLYNTFSTNQISDINNERQVHKLLDLPDYSVQNCMDYVTPNEVKLIVKNLPNKKAPGHDHLTNLMFKKLPAKGIVLMTSLFNFLLRVGHFPLSWKIATVILIKKPGKNKSNPDSYRPISLLTSRVGLARTASPQLRTGPRLNLNKANGPVGGSSATMMFPHGMFADDQVGHTGRVCVGGFLPAHPNPRKPSSQHRRQPSLRNYVFPSVPPLNARVSPGNPVRAHHTFYGMPSPVGREKHVSFLSYKESGVVRAWSA